MSTKSEPRILLLDNDSAYLARLFDVLAFNHEVCVLNDPHSVLPQLSFLQPDVIIMEMHFPEVDGVQFARQLHRNPKAGRVPFIFLASTCGSAERRLAQMVHALGCLDKSAPLKDVLVGIENILRTAPVPIRDKSTTMEQVYTYQRQMSQHGAEAKVRARESVQEKPIGVISWSELQDRWMDPSSNKQPVHRLRVLIASRDHQEVLTIESLLQRCCDTILTTSGIEAMEKAAEYLPDVLILGMRLEHMSGFQICEALRRHPAFAESPILGTVDESDRLRKSRLSRYGFDSVFVLPQDLEKLCLDVAKRAFDPDFRCHKYPMDYEKVLALEEEKRLKVEKLRGEIETTRRKAEIMNFLQEYGGNGPA
jgi:PleD family two-component response regulator